MRPQPGSCRRGSPAHIPPSPIVAWAVSYLVVQHVSNRGASFVLMQIRRVHLHLHLHPIQYANPTDVLHDASRAEQI
jgi:hypothetical protein